MKRIKNFIIITVILFLPVIVYAETITIDSIKAAYKEILACQLQINQESVTDYGTVKCKENMDYSSINIDNYVTEDKIYYKLGTSKGYFSYQIKSDNTVQFTTTLSLSNGISYDEYNEITEDFPIHLPIALIAKANGVSEDDAYSYFATALLIAGLQQASDDSSSQGSTRSVIILEDGVTADSSDDTLVIKKSEFSSHVVEYATAIRNINITIDDSNKANAFRLIATTNTSDSNKYVETYNYLINGNADFSSMTSSVISDDASKNSLDPVETITGTETTETRNNPNTGSFISIVTIFTLLVFLSLTFFIRKNYVKKI